MTAIFAVNFSGERAPKPIYQVEPPPEEITCDELYTAYLTNEEAADRAYKNQRFTFSNIEVKDITVLTSILSTSQGTYVQFKNSFTSDNIKFKLRDIAIMQNIEVGYIVDVVGWCRGQSHDGILVSDCWVNGVSHDLGIGTPVSIEY